MLKNVKGSISIFMSIIFFAVFSFGGMFVDVSRIKTAETQIKRKINLSLDLILSDYNKKLKEDYGLLAISENSSLVEEVYFDDLGLNLITELESGERYINLFDYIIEDTDIELIHNLSENEVLEYQILNFTKYKIPKEFLNKFVDLDKLAVNINEECSILNTGIEISSKFKEIHDLQKNISTNLEGISDIDLYMESKKIIQDIDDLKERIESIKERIEEINDKISNLRSSSDGDNSTAISNLKERKQKLYKKISECKDEIKQIIADYLSLLDSINECMLNVCQFSDEIKDLYNLAKDIYNDKAFNNLKSKYSSFANNFNEDLDLYKKYFSLNQIEKLKATAIKNKEIILDAEQEVKRENLEKAKLILKDYNIMDFIIKTDNSNEELKKFSPLDSVKDLIPDCFDFSAENIEDYQLKQKLPSYVDIYGGYPNKIFSEESDSESKALELNNNLSLFEFTGGGIRNALAFSKSFFGDISGIIKVAGESFLINEYILNTLNNRLTENNMEKNLYGNEKNIQESFFTKGEVEYLLTRSMNEEYSLNKVQNEIAFLRLSLNLLHLYKDPEKNKFALEIASALSGLNIGTPLLHFLILTAWALQETDHDMEVLLNCGSIPLIKGKSDWHCSINGFNEYNKKDNTKYQEKINFFQDLNNWFYKDYLRLLLFTKSKKSKLESIQDIIQLNMNSQDEGFNIASCNTCIGSNTQVSIRLLFPNIISIFKGNKINRYNYYVEAFRSY
jgi:cell division septum initiation protein DivIVA